MGADLVGLEGRVEALGRTVLLLLKALTDGGVIDGPHFAGRLRLLADQIEFDEEYLEATKQQLRKAAGLVDGWNPTRGDPAAVQGN